MIADLSYRELQCKMSHYEEPPYKTLLLSHSPPSQTLCCLCLLGQQGCSGRRSWPAQHSGQPGKNPFPGEDPEIGRWKQKTKSMSVRTLLTPAL